MKGFKFDNARRSREARFMSLELIREQVVAAREKGDAHSEMVLVIITDIMSEKWGSYAIGVASEDVGAQPLLAGVFNGMLDLRRAGENFVPDAPDTARLVAVALISGADSLSAKMVGGPEISPIVENPDAAKLLSEGYLALIVFTDLESAIFMGQGDGKVDFVGSSAPIDLDAYETRAAQLPGEENAEHTNQSDLALIVAAITARDDELAMLGS